jgi:GT2 family glycosyltransferase
VDVSIIIVNFNTRDLLAACLASIYQHTTDLAFEIIVIDNHSTDDSVAMARVQFPQVQLIVNAENIRYAQANNQGLAEATGKYVLYLNSDILLQGPTIKALYHFLETTPAAVAVGPRLIYPDGHFQDSCFRFPAVGNIFYLLCCARFYWKTWLAGNYRLEQADTAQPVDFIMGACLLARRDALQRCGGMDTDFYLYGEDADLCYRLRQQSGHSYYLPTTPPVVHYGGMSTGHLLGPATEQRQLQGWRARFQFVKKYAPRRRQMAVLLAVLLAFGVNSLLYGLAGLKRQDWNYTRRHVRFHWNVWRTAWRYLGTRVDFDGRR